ncbi:MAG: hypothetical protein H0X64_15045 [Gemmatimonadaceae bacterium]|nr:hypothetical protein [Gemmatimonadaceae bacterium]
MLHTAVAGSIAVVIGMVIGLRYGVTGVAWGYTAGYLLVSAPVATLRGFRLVDGRAAYLGRALVVPLLAAGGALVAVEAAAALLGTR